MSRVAGDGWIILRTAPSRTLRLARSLAEDGYEVWTPSRRRWVRRPRSNFRREIDFAILPSFVFARKRHFEELTELARMLTEGRGSRGGYRRGHDAFSVFKHFEQVPVISDTALEPLRREETRVPRRIKYFGPGDRVRIQDGAGSGLTGTVVKGDDKVTLVCLGPNTRWKIATSLLSPDEACGAEAPRGTAARAA